MRSAVALLAAVLLAGCQASPTLRQWTGDAELDPLVLLEREDVGPTHDRAFPVEVDEHARSLKVGLDLLTRSPALAADAPPARLDVEVRSPSGSILWNQTVHPAHPTLAFETKDLAERGAYEVRVRGQGVSQTLQGQGYGASYVLAIEVARG